MTEIILKNGEHQLCAKGEAYGRIIPVEGAEPYLRNLLNRSNKA